MTRLLPLMIIAALALTGCQRLAQSQINPMNWFRGSAPVFTTQRALVPEGPAAIYDLRQPVTEVIAMQVDRDGNGAILSATGLAPSEGWFNAQLVPVGRENGVLTYEFRIEAPPAGQPLGSDATRRITVARALSAGDLAGISVIRVLGASNARESRR